MFNNFALLNFGAFASVIALVALIIAVFEIWMIVNAILNKNIDDTRRVLWVVGMLLIHPFAAIAYFFTDYKKSR